MGERRYRQHCALAKSLDLVGDRWALLVVRDLLDGPKRYSDLLEGLVSIPTDTLAGRLKDLERHGIVGRRHLPPPADRAVYDLTDLGRGLEPVVEAYVRWGRRLIEERDPADVVRPEWLALAVRSYLRPDRAGVDLTLALHTPDGDIALHVTEGRVDMLDPPARADVTVTGTVEDLAAALVPGQVDRLVTQGRLTVDGPPAQVRQLARLFASAAARPAATD